MSWLLIGVMFEFKEEQIRAKQEEKMKKLRDIELKKQQAAILKEQDKERRREHMVIIRQLENKKRNEERKKKIEELKVGKIILDTLS